MKKKCFLSPLHPPLMSPGLILHRSFFVVTVMYGDYFKYLRQVQKFQIENPQCPSLNVSYEDAKRVSSDLNCIFEPYSNPRSPNVLLWHLSLTSLFLLILCMLAICSVSNTLRILTSNYYRKWSTENFNLSQVDACVMEIELLGPWFRQ